MYQTLAGRSLQKSKLAVAIASLVVGFPALAGPAGAQADVAEPPPATAAAAEVPTAAPATTGVPAATPADTGTELQEVVVTARKRSEPLQKVPVAVTVVTGQSLQDQNNNNLQDLAETLPSVHFVNTGSFGNNLNIRGIGSGNGNPAFDQSVAVFEDDIYYGRSRMIQASFLDMDRIEVLKGPQSTFFGNNAIAGALSLVTKKPDDHFDGYVRALYGSYGEYALESAFGGPINHQLGVRVAATADGTSGWVRNVFTDELGPNQKNYSGRITAVYKPIEDLVATLKVEGGSNNITGGVDTTPSQWTNCPPPAPLKVSSINPFCAYALQTPGEPFGLSNNLNAGLPGQFAKLNNNVEVLTLEYNKWGHTFTSVTGQYGYDYSSHKDQADTGTYLATASTPESYKQFSQELRVASAADKKIQYMAGVYFQTDNLNATIQGNSPYFTPLLPLFLTPSQFAQVQPYLPAAYNDDYGQKETIESIFGSVSWSIIDQLKVNAGLRATSVRKDFFGETSYGTSALTYGGFVADPAPVQDLLAFTLGVPGLYKYAVSERALMPSVGLQYQVADAAMLYATATHGFKAGGFNAIAPSTVAGGEPVFGPERVNSIELGLKSKWFDNKLLMNLDLFKEYYKDLQVNALVQLPASNAITLIENAASSISQGVELETQWVASKNFRLIANATYLDARYGSYPNAAPTYLQKQHHVASQNLSGAPTDFAPKWSGSVTPEVRIDIADEYELRADVTPIFTSSYFNSSGTDDPNELVGGSIRWDGRLTLEQFAQHWEVDLIGKNLTNRVIVVQPDANELPGAKQEPRNLALQVRYTF